MTPHEIRANGIGFFGLGGGQIVYVLGTDGNLWYTPAPFGTVPNPGRKQIATSVASCIPLSGSAVFLQQTLFSGANLWYVPAPFGQVPNPGQQRIDANAGSEYVPLNDKTVFVLGLDGNLWYTPAPFGTVPNPKRLHVDGSVSSYQVVDDSNIF